MSDERPMQRASDFAPEVLQLFDQYVHGLIDRRGFLRGAARYATAGVTALALLEALSPRFVYAQQIRPDDRRIDGRYVVIDSPDGYGRVRGYLVRPAAATAPAPLVLVVHENRGLNPHIEDIARRLAVDGYIAYAPDALYPLGGYPGDEDAARALFPKLDQARTHEDFVAAARWLQARPDGNGRLGVVGFCYGGGVANLLATRLPELKIAVPFYGVAPPADLVPNIRAELMLHFAGEDHRVGATWPPYEAALKAVGVRYEAYVYPGVQHGFNNDTTPRYDEAAATLAWQRTLDGFRRTLLG
ncbi:dienelactone hydrolase family protein [Solimonas marina]|uniref:Dienelactone hydrolase family protein n=1 Tax=Solimonas marina TaxID=2714601 RepID=A0A969WD73_9GAMM|nr:dienelactone hydrolase family protein [Solimonas marina]NKF23853.1 dienelactone hydrolase family protein [Solimonas marina]